MKLLLIDDDLSTADFLKRAFTEQGHVLHHAETGNDGLRLATGGTYDVLVIDRMLPELDGLAIVKTLRATGNHTPALLLTTMGGLDDRVDGLEAGADDYLVKPFALAELSARLNALARRPPLNTQQTLLRVGQLEMDLLKRCVKRDSKIIDLQPQEFKLLEFLMRSEGQVVTRTMLLEAVWNFHFDPQTSVVETHISRLRAKLDKGFSFAMIVTVRGVGYRLMDHA
jgi:two-component system, OmpR family, response regulator